MERVLRHRGGELVLGRGCLVMGILNATPDSFSDGGRFLDPSLAVGRALEMLDEGAAIIDIGGESTRPGAPPVSAAEETDRVVRVVEALKRERPDAVVSVDTTKPEVAAAAIAAGANILNDVRGASDGPPSGVADVAAESGAGLILMHSRGTPETMGGLTAYGDVFREVRDALVSAARRAESLGVSGDSIVLDPGLGFAKDASGSLELAARAAELADAGYPVLVGHSRKSFIGWILDPENPPPPEGREAGTAAVTAWLALEGVDIIRVHDVAAAVDVVKTVSALQVASERSRPL
jgi:dihydropteroate synthase